MKCGKCDGSGRIPNPDAGNCDGPWMDCDVCKGTGEIKNLEETSDESERSGGMPDESARR